MILTFLQSVLGSLTADLAFFLILVIIGVIIVVIIGLLIVFLPAILLAAVVWLLTGSIFWAGIVFLVVAALALLKKL
jgi:hypothetical protein